MPFIIYPNTRYYSAMGHIDWYGGVCYKDKQGLVVDYRKPEAILTACIYELKFPSFCARDVYRKTN